MSLTGSPVLNQASSSLTRMWRWVLGSFEKTLSASIVPPRTSSTARSVMRFRFDLGVSMIQLGTVPRVQCLAKTTEISNPC
jgi:hypothetical protein